MQFDPAWIIAGIATLGFLGGIAKLLIDIGKNTQITEQILKNQTAFQENVTTLTEKHHELDTRLTKLESTHAALHGRVKAI